MKMKAFNSWFSMLNSQFSSHPTLHASRITSQASSIKHHVSRIVLLLFVAFILASCGSAQDSASGSTDSSGQDKSQHATGSVTPMIALQSKLLDQSTTAGFPKAGELAPNFQFTLEDGKTMKLSDLHGKKVIVNFWATWCEPCRQEMPDLQKAAQKYGNSVAIIGVNTLERAEAIKPYAEELQIGFPLVADPEGTIKNRYGVLNMPTSYFIDSSGTINPVREKNLATGGTLTTDSKLGAMSYTFITQQLDQLK